MSFILFFFCCLVAFGESMPTKTSSLFSITVETKMGPGEGGPMQPSNSIASVSYYLVNTAKTDQYICLTVFSDKLSLRNIETGKLLAGQDDRPSLAVSQKPCKTKADATRLKAGERLHILTASADKDKDGKYKLSAGSHQSFASIAEGRYEMELEFNFSVLTDSVTSATAIGKAALDLSAQNSAQAQVIEDFWKEFDELLKLGPMPEKKINVTLLGKTMKKITTGLGFIKPPDWGEPTYPLGGIQLNIVDEVKIGRGQLPAVYEKRAFNSQPDFLQTRILHIGFSGDVFFYFDDKGRLYHVEIHWSSKSAP